MTGSGTVYRLTDSDFVADIDSLRDELACGYVEPNDQCPCAVNRRYVSSPIPEAAPVTIATVSGCRLLWVIMGYVLIRGEAGRFSAGGASLSYSLRRFCAADLPARTARW